MIAAIVTVAFDASIDSQAGAYATGVLALMTSAAVAVFLTERRRGHRRAAAFFAAVSAIFVYTFAVTIIERPEGLVIAGLFIALIVVISVWSRITRSTELRVQRVTYDETALELLEQAARGLEPMRIIANKRQAGDEDEHRNKLNTIRTRNHMRFPAAVFLEVDVSDASDFETAVTVTSVSVDEHRILRATGPSVPNVLAAILLDLRDRMPAHPACLLRVEPEGAGRKRATLPDRRRGRHPSTHA